MALEMASSEPSLSSRCQILSSVDFNLEERKWRLTWVTFSPHTRITSKSGSPVTQIRLMLVAGGTGANEPPVVLPFSLFPLPDSEPPPDSEVDLKGLSLSLSP